MNQKLLSFFADYIYRESGIHYTQEDYYRLIPRLQTIIKHFKLETIEDLYEKFCREITEEMHSVLIDVATNNETYFMRDAKPFKALGKVLIKELLESFNLINVIRIWSAGCSTGQEVWSILMSLDNFSKIEDVTQKVRIDATDISTSVLEKAQKGNFDVLEVQRGLPAPMLLKYFSQEKDESWSIRSEFKSRVSFREHNLLTEECPKNAYHIIFCRNVLIYQTPENRKFILQKLFGALKQGGYLFLGTGESMIGMKLPFKQMKIEEALLYQK